MPWCCLSWCLYFCHLHGSLAALGQHACCLTSWSNSFEVVCSNNLALVHVVAWIYVLGSNARLPVTQKSQTALVLTHAYVWAMLLKHSLPLRWCILINYLTGVVLYIGTNIMCNCPVFVILWTLPGPYPIVCGSFPNFGHTKSVLVVMEMWA